MQCLVRLRWLLRSTCPALIQGTTQAIDIVVFAILGLGRSEIAQDMLLVLTPSTSEVRFGTAHTTTDISRIPGHAFCGQSDRLLVGAEAEFKVDELVTDGAVIGIECQGSCQAMPGTLWLQFALHGGQGNEILLPRLATHLHHTLEVCLGICIVPERLLTLGQEQQLRDIVSHEASPQVRQRLSVTPDSTERFTKRPVDTRMLGHLRQGVLKYLDGIIIALLRQQQFPWPQPLIL